LCDAFLAVPVYTDQLHIHRLAQLAFAIALILTVKLVRWAERWNA
jgi:hypothetical protein